MSAGPETPSGDRYVRVCPKHGLELEPGAGDQLKCPRRHTVTEWRVVDREKGRAVSHVDREKGEIGIMNEKAPTPDQTANATLDRKRFVDASGLVLFLALRKEPKRFGGDPFRIRWRLEESRGGKSKKGQQGVSVTAPTELEARAKFKAAIAGSVKDGWKEEASVFGRRSLTLKAIPAPRKKAS